MKGQLRILWLKSGPLHPLDTGGKIRTYNMLTELMKAHQITFMALCDSAVGESTKAAASEYSHQQIWIPWKETRKGTSKFACEVGRNWAFSRKPYVIQKYFSADMSRTIQKLDSTGQFDLIICDFLTPAVNLFPTAGKLRTPTLLFQHNVESVIWKRLFENSAGVVKRGYFKQQWKRMEKFERQTCERCDGVAGVSEDDCRILKTQFGLRNILGSVPTGANLSYFCPTSQPRKKHSLIFLGSMDWMPNIDAICHFAETIFPAIKVKFTDATCVVVGRNPAQRVKDLEKQQPGFSVTGTVPDVRPYLAEAEVMIVPLRIGGGTRIKIYEGMATGIPIISSTIGAEGLPLAHRENIFMADSPEDFVHGIVELFENRDLRKRIGDNGRSLVQRQFGWDAVTKTFEQYCFEACACRNT